MRFFNLPGLKRISCQKLGGIAFGWIRSGYSKIFIAFPVLTNRCIFSLLQLTMSGALPTESITPMKHTLGKVDTAQLASLMNLGMRHRGRRVPGSLQFRNPLLDFWT